MDTAVEIVDELRQMRRALGVTQADLAARIGVGEGTLRRWERRQRRPNLDDLVAWFDELGFAVTLAPDEHAKAALALRECAMPGCRRRRQGKSVWCLAHASAT